MDITKDIPIILNETTYDVNNTGDHLNETRSVIWTLSFTVQGWLFGPVNTDANGIILQAIVNLYDSEDLTGKDIVLVTGPDGYGTFKIGETIFQGKSIETTQATAIVVSWSPEINRLIINNPAGEFKINSNLNGLDSGASWPLINYEIIPSPIETITVTAISANTSDTEFS